MIRGLETRRLILRPLELGDASQAQALFANWEIVRFLASRVPWPYPADGCETYYRDVAIPGMERGDEWHSSLRLKDAPNQLIGSIALTRGEEDNRGFWIGLPWQRLGLMSEGVEAANDYWFDELSFQVLRAPKAVDNLASRRISEKTGMRIVASMEKNFVSGRFLSETWEITADEWRARRSGKGQRPVHEL